MSKQVETEHFIIRAFTVDDGEDIREYAIYKQGTGFEAYNAWPIESEGCKGVANFFAGQHGKYWAVCRKYDGKVIGFVSYNGIDEEKCLDLGHGFTLKYNQNGEDVEALTVMIQYAFDTMDIYAIDARNEKEWIEQVSPLYKLKFVVLDDKMQITKSAWVNRMI